MQLHLSSLRSKPCLGVYFEELKSVAGCNWYLLSQCHFNFILRRLWFGWCCNIVRVYSIIGISEVTVCVGSRYLLMVNPTLSYTLTIMYIHTHNSFMVPPTGKRKYKRELCSQSHKLAMYMEIFCLSMWLLTVFFSSGDFKQIQLLLCLMSLILKLKLFGFDWISFHLQNSCFEHGALLI